jgi:hypothetical protein
MFVGTTLTIEMHVPVWAVAATKGFIAGKKARFGHPWIAKHKQEARHRDQGFKNSSKQDGSWIMKLLAIVTCLKIWCFLWKT